MDLYNEIAKVAYELYEKNGYIQSRDLDHWLEAEKIVMARLAEEKKIKSEKKPANKPEKKTEAKVEPKTKRPVRKKTK
jgi:hypothetical protein